MLLVVFDGTAPLCAQTAPPPASAPPVSAPSLPATMTPAAGTTFADVFASSRTPISLTWGELGAGWFKFTASEQSEGGVYAQFYGSLLGVNDYYTQGTTISVGSETYLVAYRPESRSLDIAELMNSYTKPPKPAPLTPGTPLALCLLNVRTLGSLKDIQPLDAHREASAKAAVRQDIQQYVAHSEGERGSLVSETNLKRLGGVLLEYAHRKNGTLPPLGSAAQAKSALFKFAKTETLFINPQTHQPYQPNPALSRHKLAAIASRSEMVVYYDPMPSDEGLRSVLYLDGHTRRVSQADWPRVKRASKIP